MLFYRELKNILPNTRGIEDPQLVFQELYIDSSRKVSKGLYLSIPNENEEEYLKEALYNGAIGAIWSRGKKAPSFLPNHFPIFLVDNSLMTLKEIIHFYENFTERNRYEIMSKFTLSYRKTHNGKNNTYDSAVMEEIQKIETELSTILNQVERGR